VRILEHTTISRESLQAKPGRGTEVEMLKTSSMVRPINVLIIDLETEAILVLQAKCHSPHSRTGSTIDRIERRILRVFLSHSIIAVALNSEARF